MFHVNDIVRHKLGGPKMMVYGTGLKIPLDQGHIEGIAVSYPGEDGMLKGGVVPVSVLNLVRAGSNEAELQEHISRLQNAKAALLAAGQPVPESMEKELQDAVEKLGKKE